MLRVDGGAFTGTRLPVYDPADIGCQGAPNMRMRGVALVVAILAGLLLLVPASASAGTGSPPTQAINIKNQLYKPPYVAVVAGTVVTWTNNDLVHHSVTSDTGAFDSSPTNCGHGQGTSGCIQPGQTFQITFSTPGNYDYHCRLHQHMHGTVQVLAVMPGVTVVHLSPSGLPAFPSRNWSTTVTVSGEGFTSGAIVSFSGSGVKAGTTKLISGTTLTAPVTVLAGQTPGVRDVTVTDPAVGGSGTCAGCLSLDPVPAPTAANPNTISRFSSGVWVTFTGSNFVSGATVTAKPAGIAITDTKFVNSSELQSFVYITNGAPGLYDIRVTNPDKGYGDCMCMTVT